MYVSSITVIIMIIWNTGLWNLLSAHWFCLLLLLKYTKNVVDSWLMMIHVNNKHLMLDWVKTGICKKCWKFLAAVFLILWNVETLTRMEDVATCNLSYLFMEFNQSHNWYTIDVESNHLYWYCDRKLNINACLFGLPSFMAVLFTFCHILVQ